VIFAVNPERAREFQQTALEVAFRQSLDMVLEHRPKKQPYNHEHGCHRDRRRDRKSRAEGLWSEVQLSRAA